MSAASTRSVNQLIHQGQVMYRLPGGTRGINGTLSDCDTHWLWSFFILLACSCRVTSLAPQTEANLPNAQHMEPSYAKSYLLYFQLCLHVSSLLFGWNGKTTITLQPHRATMTKSRQNNRAPWKNHIMDLVDVPLVSLSSSRVM